MWSKQKNRKQGQNTEKNNQSQQHKGATAIISTASLNDAEVDGEEIPVNLTVIPREIRDFRQDYKKQMEDINSEMAKTNARVEMAEARILETEERLQNVEGVTAEMQKLHEQLQAKLVDQEWRLRRENIRIYGIPEGAEGETIH